MAIQLSSIFLAVLFACVPFTVASAAQHHTQSTIQKMQTAQYRLLRRARQFSLKVLQERGTKEVRIPREWLVPEKEEAEEESDSFVSSFNYDPQVQSIAVGDGRVGLHISSYAFLVGGSAQAAAGRDVFLIFNPKTLELREGGIRRGITKARVRDRGCFAAKSERYLIGDIDGDGLTDVGVVVGELQCIEKSDGWLAGPFYKESPVTWYVLHANGWMPDPHYDGQAPTPHYDLPLIGMACGPLDAAGCEGGCSPGCDRSRWPREIYKINARGVTTHFGGNVPPDSVPLQSGVSALWFTFEGDPQNYGFASMTKEPGDAHLDFSDWSLDIFSPNGAFVFILQDTYGPYHIVATDKLKDTLTSGRKPDYVVAKAVAPNEPERVYGNGHRISTSAVQFTVSCCGSSETLTHTLPE